MNAINLITLLYGRQGPQPAAGAASNSPPGEPGAFIRQLNGSLGPPGLNLEAVAAGLGPATAANTGIDDAGSSNALLAGFASAALDAGANPAVAAAWLAGAQSGREPAAMEQPDAGIAAPGQLLASLAAAIQAGLAGDRLAPGTLGQDGSPAAGRPASYPVPGTADATAGAGLELLFTGWPNVIKSWSAQLAALAGGSLRATAGEPLLVPGSPSGAPVPWQAVPGLAAGLSEGQVGASTKGGGLGGAPASIRWFAGQAGPGSNAAIALPASTGLSLASGETLMLSLSQAPAQGLQAGQEYILTAWSPGSDLGTLVARLRLQQLDPPLQNQLPVANLQGAPGDGESASSQAARPHPQATSALQLAAAAGAAQSRQLLAAGLNPAMPKSAPWLPQTTGPGPAGGEDGNGALAMPDTTSASQLGQPGGLELLGGAFNGRGPASGLGRAGFARASIPGLNHLASQDPGLADGQYQPQMPGLPAQLMQFSSREPDLRPYAGLEFRELAAALLSEADTARARGDGTYQATFDLNPPNLGRVSVNIAVRGENVALQLAVASSAPREQLKQGLAALQQSLEDAGLKVLGMKVVTIDPDASGSAGHGNGQDEHSREPGQDETCPGVSFQQYVRDSGTDVLRTKSA